MRPAKGPGPRECALEPRQGKTIPRDRPRETQLSFPNAAATPSQTRCSSNQPDRNRPRTPTRKRSCRPPASPRRVQEARRPRQSRSPPQTHAAPRLMGLDPPHTHPSESTTHPGPSSPKTAHPDGPKIPPAHLLVSGTSATPHSASPYGVNSLRRNQLNAIARQHEFLDRHIVALRPKVSVPCTSRGRRGSAATP